MVSELAATPCEGRARRSGRRRDLRWLCALPDRLSRTMPQGGNRRHQYNGNFVVTPESIIPHLTVLQEYKPLIRQLFSKGLFGPLDERYFRLIDRSADMQGRSRLVLCSIGWRLRAISRDLQLRTQREEGGLFRFDDAFRFQMPAARAACRSKTGCRWRTGSNRACRSSTIESWSSQQPYRPTSSSKAAR